MARSGVFRRVGAALALLAPLLSASPARAEVGVFLGFNTGYWGPGYYAPRPYYAPLPPPAYYPPPGYYAPPAYYAPPPGPPVQACYAGPYMCQLDQPVPAGSSCSCPVNDKTRVFGRAG